MKVNKTLVVISAMISLVMLLATSCGSKDQDERYSPYKFNTTALDSLVDLKQALIDVVYRPDSSIREKRYYLGDSVKMVLTYNKQGALLNVTRHEDAIEVWTENYYPNGQRLSRFHMYTDPKTGESHYHGVYKSYYQTGWLKKNTTSKRLKKNTRLQLLITKIATLTLPRGIHRCFLNKMQEELR